MKYSNILPLICSLLLLPFFQANAQKANELKAAIFSNKAGAIKGYDPVAYFNQGMAVKGKADIQTKYEGAIFHFSTTANKEAFETDPEKYTPQYGGYCAWAVSQGYTAPINPNSWAIVDDKLYLNYNRKIQKKWDNDRVALIRQADKNYPGLVKKP